MLSNPLVSHSSPINVYVTNTCACSYQHSCGPPAEFISPVQGPYQYIIFRASEVKDLVVDEPEPRRSVHDDSRGEHTPFIRAFLLQNNEIIADVNNSKGFESSECARNRVDTSVAFLLIFDPALLCLHKPLRTS